EAVSRAGHQTTTVSRHRLPMLLRVPAHVGDSMAGLGRGMLGVVGFLGQMVLATLSLLRHPARVRGKALIHQMELVGVNALA
ncbi:hypothetical protein ABTF80_21490, partial [Acinetobacter baumannii]